jgi:ATP-dependent helicase/nuclease subunit A
LLTGFIDRLVLLEDAGQVVAAEIIDFKTDPFDAQDPQQLAAKIAFYAPQMRAYRRAVSHMTNCPPERIIASLLFVEAGIVQPVSDPARG